MEAPPIITLLTDFGLSDGHVGVMKGVIWGICPQAQSADITHLIRPQHIAEAAYLLCRVAPHFPPGTVHLVVIDPGVGTERRPMAARIGRWFYVGPDNGALTLLLERAQCQGWEAEFVCLSRPQYWLPQVSAVFHGRDVFAPCAAHLARGVPLQAMGDPFVEPMRLALAHPERTIGGWRGEVIHIDRFGNLMTNIRQEHLTSLNPQKLVVYLKGRLLTGMVRAFGERASGEYIALLNSDGDLMLSQVQWKCGCQPWRGNRRAGRGREPHTRRFVMSALPSIS